MSDIASRVSDEGRRRKYWTTRRSREDDDEDVRIQTEAAIRHLANQFAYDNDEDGRITLLTGGDQLFHALHIELQERLARAGVKVEEARLAHLAYAPEIAQAMLSRQQAEAVIGARQKIRKWSGNDGRDGISPVARARYHRARSGTQGGHG